MGHDLAPFFIKGLQFIILARQFKEEMCSSSAALKHTLCCGNYRAILIILWCNGYEERPTQTFTIIHVADAFIQSDL